MDFVRAGELHSRALVLGTGVVISATGCLENRSTFSRNLIVSFMTTLVLCLILSHLVKPKPKLFECFHLNVQEKKVVLGEFLAPQKSFCIFHQDL